MEQDTFEYVIYSFIYICVCVCVLHGNRSREVGNPFQWFQRSRELWNCMGTLPFQRELQWELGKAPGALKTVFFLEFRHFLGLGNTKPIEKYTELPTKHEPMLKLETFARRKAKDIFNTNILNWETGAISWWVKGVSPRCKGDIWDVKLMSISFVVYVYISQKIVCAYCMCQSMLKH